MSSEGWGVSRGRGTESRPLRQRLKQSPLNILAASSWKATFPENSIVFQIFYGEKMFSWEKYSVGALKLWKSEGVKNRTQAGSHIWFQKRQFLQFAEFDLQGFTVTELWSTETGSLVPMIGFRKILVKQWQRRKRIQIRKWKCLTSQLEKKQKFYLSAAGNLVCSRKMQERQTLVLKLQGNMRRFKKPSEGKLL